ncbi:hypothetical protein MTBUT4_70095 [Magnetospirillum sp. UT-4]|nr:hypothetical protein MTBUT4_70095 [Magnetospirillum sp. UT-4]
MNFRLRLGYGLAPQEDDRDQVPDRTARLSAPLLQPPRPTSVPGTGGGGPGGRRVGRRLQIHAVPAGDPGGLENAAGTAGAGADRRAGRRRHRRLGNPQLQRHRLPFHRDHRPAPACRHARRLSFRFSALRGAAALRSRPRSGARRRRATPGTPCGTGREGCREPGRW